MKEMSQIKNRKIGIRLTRDEDQPKYIVYGDGGYTIYGSFINYDEAARKKAYLEKRINELGHEKFLMKLKK